MLLGLGSFRYNAHAHIQQFLGQDEANDTALTESVYRDIKRCFYRYKTTPLEYFLFKLRSKSANEREQYLSDSVIMKSVANKSGRRIHDIELNNKYNFYCINKTFFKRTAMLFDKSTELDAFAEFATKAKRVIAKPNEAALGAGVEIFDIRDSSDSADAFNLLKGTTIDYIVEELIVQSHEMAMWNQSSVNTIRINSFLHNDRFNVLYPFMRTGRKGCIVDNGGQGGIFAIIDKDSGEIISDGMDEKANIYTTHPDSEIKYKGNVIPQWPELLALTEKIHRNMPRHRYVSWDFALTNDGWVLIEGNWGEFVCQQMTLGRGLKNEFLTLLNQ